MSSNVDMTTMSICNSDSCTCYYKHSLELTSTIVTLFFFHFGSEITCEISRWIKQVMSRSKIKVGERGLLFKKILIENIILCVLSSTLIEKLQDSLLRHSF